MKLCKIEEIPTEQGELWKFLKTPLYPDIVPMYYISSKGRVYNGFSRTFLHPRCLDPEKHGAPYYQVSLQIEINGKHYSKSFKVHRIELSVFRPVHDMEKLVVNHKDCDKLNNDLSNLEWATFSENTIHAIMMKTFIPVHGENHCCATITDYEAKRICDLLVSRKYTYSEIANIVGTTESIVGSIATKKAWKHILHDYDMSVLKQRLPKVFTLDQIKQCCEYFETHKRINISVRRHCMNALKFINYEKEITESALNSIRLLYKKQRYLSISNNYNF